VETNNFSEVILVDIQDNEIGKMEKLEAHVKGELHRAFSVFIFNNQNELLLQRRAFGKYHSEGLWTNTCCSHPAPGETVLQAANRRLMEEMELECPLESSFSFIYKAELENNLIEYELDHVMIGFSDETPHINPSEAIAFKWLSLETIVEDIKKHPEHYTAWFKIILTDHLSILTSHLSHESLSKNNI
jgi:isopentenyl-diphosphate delta-isomerase